VGRALVARPQRGLWVDILAPVSMFIPKGKERKGRLSWMLASFQAHVKYLHAISCIHICLTARSPLFSVLHCPQMMI